MSKELKPCPFCGGEAEYKERGDEYSGITETSVICKKMLCKTNSQMETLQV